MIELVAPGGNLEKFKIAFLYGADAVYCGGKQYSLRAQADNLTLDEISEGTGLAHGLSKRIYITVNIFAHNRDFDKLPEYLHQLKDIGVDALIISDPGIIQLAKKETPELPIHLSTQANTTNAQSVQFWEAQGVKRIILARELSRDEIAKTSKNTAAGLEMFVHGALCMSYSGRCYISDFLTGRNANQGDCTHPCRWEYSVSESSRPGEYFPVEEDSRGAYFFNSRDLCLIEYIPDIARTGIRAVKVEGRMKTIHYIALVIRAYRQAIDNYTKDPGEYRLDKGMLDDLKSVTHRQYTSGFFKGRPGQELYNWDADYEKPVEFLGIVENVSGCQAVIGVRGKFSVGDQVRIIRPDRKGDFIQQVITMHDAEDAPVNTTKPNTKVLITFDQEVAPGDLIRKVSKF